MRYVFQEVSQTREKSGLCKVCGKRAVRRKKFWQTMNPYNKNASGEVKTHTEIMREIRAEANDWGQVQVMHVGCERMRDESP